MKKRILHILLFAAALALGVLAAAKLTVRKTEVGTLMQEKHAGRCAVFWNKPCEFWHSARRALGAKRHHGL